MDTLSPKDHREAVALFRSQIIGELAVGTLERGELREKLRRLSRQHFRSPGATKTRTYSVPTLERWVYAWRRGGLAALMPKARNDRGRARRLTARQRELLLDIRREYPSASCEIILRTLVADGRLDHDVLSPATMRRLYAEHGLDRVSLQRAGKTSRQRLRWQAEQPNALWHGDVCHGPTLVSGGRRTSLRIHALLDDASRYVVALEAHSTEKEDDLLGLLVAAFRRHGRPDGLYFDNGSTYRGNALATICARLGISLLHARPYDPQARGKMERFWRTLREGCLDYLGDDATLHDVNVRLWAFLDQHYHGAPHAGLLGRAPATVFAERQRKDQPCDDKALKDAFTVRERRRVRRDSTVSVAGRTFEVDAGFLAGRVITVGRCLLDPPTAPWIEHDGKRFVLHQVDPTKNGKKKRQADPPDAAAGRSVDFDPPKALLDRLVGRTPAHEEVTP